jgi:hypothetical protein
MTDLEIHILDLLAKRRLNYLEIVELTPRPKTVNNLTHRERIIDALRSLYAAKHILKTPSSYYQIMENRP